VDAFDMGGSKKAWPLGLGYDRFYGFIGGETNQWYPELIEDNHFVEQPYQPEDGYHFSKDIVDKAITFIQDGKQSRPKSPGICGCARGPTTRRTTRPRTTSRSTKASSMTATKRTGNGY
jgi:arylsulfatase A-like enzyme